MFGFLPMVDWNIIVVHGVAYPNLAVLRTYHGLYIIWLLIPRCARMMKTRYFSEKKNGFDDSFDVT